MTRKEKECNNLECWGQRFVMLSCLFLPFRCGLSRKAAPVTPPSVPAGAASSKGGRRRSPMCEGPGRLPCTMARPYPVPNQVPHIIHAILSIHPSSPHHQPRKRIKRKKRQKTSQTCVIRPNNSHLFFFFPCRFFFLNPLLVIIWKLVVVRSSSSRTKY